MLLLVLYFNLPHNKVAQVVLELIFRVFVNLLNLHVQIKLNIAVFLLHIVFKVVNSILKVPAASIPLISECLVNYLLKVTIN